MSPRAHLLACRGLTLAETGWLAAALTHPDPQTTLTHLHGVAKDRLRAALAWCPARHAAEIAHKIRTRCLEAHTLGLSRVHPTWIEDLCERERPQAIQIALGTRDTPTPGMPEASAAWLEAALAARFGALDPRHAWELRQSQVLELDQLRLIRGRDLNLLVTRTGLALLAEGLRNAPAREIASVARRLGTPLDKAFVAAIQRPLGWSPEALVLARHALKMTAQNRQSADRRAVQLGLYALAAAAGRRRPDTARGLAAAMNLDKGRWLLSCWRSLPKGPTVPTLSDEIALWLLHQLGRLSKAGLTRDDHAPRTPLIAPTTPHDPPEVTP